MTPTDALDPTPEPTHAPSMSPTTNPTGQPTSEPSGQPTSNPTMPTGQPSSAPTKAPTESPTEMPSYAPTVRPTLAGGATHAPTFSPTREPTQFPTEMPTAAPTEAPSIPPPLNLKRVYLMVEDESPPRYYDANQLVNQAYFRELFDRAYEYGFQLGVFTTFRYWTELMETNEGETVQFSRENVPLWTPRFDKVANNDFFVPFGGWSTNYMKQYDGGSSPARRQTSTWRINRNYTPWSMNSTTIDPVAAE
jgi:hypothetical protein